MRRGKTQNDELEVLLVVVGIPFANTLYSYVFVSNIKVRMLRMFIRELDVWC